MNKEKVFIEGYEVGFLVDTTGAREKKIQVASGEIVSIDERFIYKSIEREKVAIPQFVADWIEEARETTYNIRGAIEMAPNGRVKDWLELKNVNIFAEAWVNGYEIEKEKRYRVKFIQTGQHLAKNIFPSSEYFVIKTSSISSTDSFTQKELEEANFGWVFDCPGIKIEEVE